jgi:hypothetical protein
LSSEDYEKKIEEINTKIKEINFSILNRERLKEIETKKFQGISFKVEKLGIQKINLNKIIKNLRAYESYKKVCIEYEIMMANIQKLKLSTYYSFDIFEKI